MARMHDSQLAWEWGSSSSGTGGGTVTRARRPRWRRKRSCPQAPSIDALTVSPESVRYLWRLYRFHPEHMAYRDRLVEFYLPWVTKLAESIAEQMKLADPENASGECLLLFTFKILPSFNGSGSFVGYAKMCIKRKMVDLRRQQLRQKEFVGLVDHPDGKYWLDSLAAPVTPPRGVDWQQMTACLTKFQAKIIRLRFQRYLSAEEAADVLGCSKSSVKLQSRKAMAAIRDKWGECPDELRR